MEAKRRNSSSQEKEEIPKESSFRSHVVSSTPKGGPESCQVVHTPDINIRSTPTAPPDVVWLTERGLTPMELAAGDECMMGLLTDYHIFQNDVSTSAFDI